MKKIKPILTAIGMIAISLVLYSADTQHHTTLDQLSAPKMWTLDLNPKEIYSFKQFTRTHITQGMINEIENKTISWANPYYLSDTEVTVFDPTKVGKVESGKYIIVEQLPGGPPKFYEIKSINTDVLVLFYDSKGQNIPDTTTSTSYAIKDGTPPVDPTPPADPKKPIGGDPNPDPTKPIAPIDWILSIPGKPSAQ